MSGSNVILGELRDGQNPFNTAAIAISLVIIIGASCLRAHKVWTIIQSNFSSMLFIILVLLSTTWSIHPDMSFRRGVGYVLTIAASIYLVARFSFHDILRVFSLAFAISAGASIAFVAAYPEYGVMQFAELKGAWQGVFSHKNPFGLAMATAVFIEVTLLATSAKVHFIRYLLLACFFSLVILSRSHTALIMATCYIGGAVLYIAWFRGRDGKLAASLALLYLAATTAVASACLLYDPELLFSTIGKDVSLTGRTTIWQVVSTELVSARPILGWGYRAVWNPNDATTLLIDQLVGWGVVNSHNSFLEITVQLGFLGAILLVLILFSALWRSFRCCRSNAHSLGWFSLVFVAVAILAGLVEDVLGQNQTIAWVTFNVLLFSCGLRLTAIRTSQHFGWRGVSHSARAPTSIST